jgi:hypothetical protein
LAREKRRREFEKRSGQRMIDARRVAQCIF